MDVPYSSTSVFSERVKDKNWVRRAFGLDNSSVEQAIDYWRTFTTADMKFTDTSLGGNFAINNPPQFTPYADIRRSGISIYGRDPGMTKVTETNSLGMGRYYSEAIDDHAQLVHMQFGVMKFRGMLSFFTGFYSNSASLLAREGRAPITYYIGRIAGAILTLPLWPFVLAGQAARYMMDRPGTKYAYFVPAMGPYWNRANMIANAIGVNTKMVAHVFDDNDIPSADEPMSDADHYRKYMSQLDSNMFRPDGSIDLFATANKAQRLANQYRREMSRIGETVSSAEDLKNRLNGYFLNTKLRDKNNSNIKDYLSNYHSTVLGDVAWAEEKVPEMAPAEPGVPELSSKLVEEQAGSGVLKWIQGWGTRAGDFLEADTDHGSGFVTFRVDYSGTQQDSFSNQVKDPEIRSKINGISSAAKSARHTFSDGMTGVGAVDAVTSSVRGLIGGAMDSVKISGLLALAGNAFVDIPQVWEDSTCNLARTSYTMQLRTPYGDPVSRMQNLYIPICLLLAAALPNSAGAQSYTTPFYCQAFSKGMRTIRMGMITDISISRGVGNLGWTKNWEPLGFDVSFTVTDLSSVMHAPVTTGFDFFNPFRKIFADDTTFSDFLAALSSMDYKDQYYKQRQFWFNLTKVWLDYKAFFSTAQTTNMIGNSALGRITSAVLGDAYATNAR